MPESSPQESLAAKLLSSVDEPCAAPSKGIRLEGAIYMETPEADKDRLYSTDYYGTTSGVVLNNIRG